MGEKENLKNEKVSQETKNIDNDRFSSENLLRLWIKDELNKKEKEKKQID